MFTGSPWNGLWKLGTELFGGGDRGLTIQNHFDSSHCCGNWEVEDSERSRPGPVFLSLQENLCRNHNINNL